MDMATKKVEWHEPIIPGAQWYTDMTMTPSGLVYGVADRKIFFVFDAAKRAIVHKFDLEPTLGQTSYEQAPRVFVAGPAGATYMMLSRGVARVDPTTYEVKLIAKAPIEIDAGGVYLDGRIYFAGGSHLYSWKVD
jgi:hypothetical protein